MIFDVPHHQRSFPHNPTLLPKKECGTVHRAAMFQVGSWSTSRVA
jgi:hypothetical protein